MLHVKPCNRTNCPDCAKEAYIVACIYSPENLQYLAQRNVELEAELTKGLPHDCIIVPLAAWNDMSTQEMRFERRIAELEKVAAAAAAYIVTPRRTNRYRIEEALRAAGYLGGGDE